MAPMEKAPPRFVATTRSGEILRYMSMAPFILLCCGVFGLRWVLLLSQPLRYQLQLSLRGGRRAGSVLIIQASDPFSALPSASCRVDPVISRLVLVSY